MDTPRLAIRASYFLRVRNVGDRINPHLLQAATGLEVKYYAERIKPHLLAVGSVMAGASSASQIWGTGVMHPQFGVGDARGENIHAIRGPLSLKVLREAGVTVKDVPFGDAGFLAPQLLNIARSATPKFRLGIVAHYVDRAHPVIKKLLAEDGVADLNVHDDEATFLGDMANCEAVVSTSLHGLIFAEALHIPNLWMRTTNKIAGGTFKYDDWFATTRRPQHAWHELSERDCPTELAKMATLHDSLIDTDALLGAFPKDRLDSMVEPLPQDAYSTDQCRKRPLPVFLISFNRGGMLETSITGLKQQNRPTDIVVHDGGSSDPTTIEILRDLEQRGTKIRRIDPLSTQDKFSLIDETVRDYFSDWAEPQPYAVSDCAIDMSVAAPGALDIYLDLLDRVRQVAVAGPMLRIRDISTTYPFYNRVTNRHIEQFWSEIPRFLECSAGTIAAIHAPIETTLGVHRAGESFRHTKSGVRVYEPYEAKCLDWYVTRDPAEARTHAVASNTDISHWHNEHEDHIHRDATLDYTCFNAVRATADGQIEAYLERLPSAVTASPDERIEKGIGPFASASEQVKADRIAHIERLRDTGASDIERWRNPFSHKQAWQERVAAMADFVRSGERVLEFGPGKSKLKEYLPSGCTYAGFDLAPLEDNILFYDLNAQRLKVISDFDVAFYSGVLEYVHDLDRLIAFQYKSFRTVICSYAVARQITEDEIQQRRYSGWVTDFSLSNFEDLFNRHGFVKARSGEWGAQYIFRFDRTEALG